MKKAIIIIFSLIFVVLGFAQEDAYHQALRAQLQSQYGISGGQFILSETEAGFYNKMNTTGVNKKQSTYEGEEPFTSVIDLTIPTQKSNPWENAVRVQTLAPVEKGDVLLWVIWYKGVEATEGYGHVENVFEMTTDPYTKSIAQDGELLPEWQQWMLPFVAAADYPVNGGRLQLNLGYMQGKIQIAGAAIINFKDKYTKDQLPLSNYHLNYVGREEGAQWRIDALQRIENIRKGDLKINVINKNGQPIKDANVKVNMVRHWFGFGTAISAGLWANNSLDAGKYWELVENLNDDYKTFSVVVFENATKWGPWEDDNHLGSKEDVAEITDWLKSCGIRVRGHNLVWPKFEHLPADLQEHQNDVNYLTERIANHIAEEAGWDGLKGVIDEWDVINEMVHCKDLENIYGSYDCYVDWLNLAHEADPNAILYLNEYSLITGGAKDVNSQTEFKNILQYVIDAGAPIHGLGIQGHMGTDCTPPERVIDVFNQFGEFGLDMSVTEYDAVATMDELAADYMRDILIATFAQPRMRNFLMWGFWDGAHWAQDAPLYTKDWTLKPSGQVFKDLVFNQWWTNDEGLTNHSGIYTSRAFYGLYDVDVEFDGVKAYASVDFVPGFNEQVTVMLDTESLQVEKDATLPTEFALQGNYPNPFNPSTTIRYALPEHAFVEMHIYDTMGRQVRELVSGRQNAGFHTIEFNAENLPSGTYYCKMFANGFSDTMKLMLVK